MDKKIVTILCGERDGSVVECLTRDRGVAGLSLTRSTALCPWARHFILCLEIVQPRKSCPDMTGKYWLWRKESNLTKQFYIKRLILWPYGCCMRHLIIAFTVGTKKKILGKRYTSYTGPQIRVCNRKLFFLFLNQNICCGYSKEPSHRDGSFEHPKHKLKLMVKKIIAILS